MKKSYTFGLASLVVTLAKKQTTKRIGFVAGLLLAFGMTAFSQTNYYLITDSVAKGKAVAATVIKAAFWSTNASVTGQRPADFVTDGQVFNIQVSGLTNSKPWVVSGAGSKIVVGTDTTTTALTFTSNAASSITATVDVKPNSTFIYNSLSTSTITWGTLSTGSTVDFGGSTSGFQEVIPASYANLSLKSNGGGYPAILPNGKTVSVSGVFTPRGGQIYGSTIVFNGGGGQVIPAGTYYNLSITGNKTNPDTLKGNVIVEGTYSNSSTGATIQPFIVNPITKAITNSTLTLNGFGTQTIGNHPFGNITFANGQNSNISSINNSASTVTLQAPDPGLSVGDIVTAKNAAFALDSATSILSINDTVLTLSNAPKLQLFVHEASGVRDTVLINSWNVAVGVDSSFVLTAAPKFNVGDTVTATIIAAPAYAKTSPFAPTAGAIVSSINGNTITVKQLSNKGFALQNANNLGVINFGSPTGKPSAKTISGLVSISGNLTVGNAPVTTTGSTIEFKGKRQNVPGITYDNLIINQDSATTAALQASATVEGTFTLQSGRIATNTTTKLLTLGENAVFAPVTNDTFFVVGGLAKKFAAAKPFIYKVGVAVAGAGTPRTVTITPATADAKTYTVNYALGKTSNSARIDSATITTLDTLSYYNVALSGYTAGTDTTAQVSFEFVPSSYFKDSSVILAHYFHGKYTAGSSFATFNGTTPLTFTTSGYDSIFGRYTIATASANVVPVKFGTVSASLLANKSVKISWESYTESSVSKYVVEGSTNGINFSTKGTLAAKGASQYSFIDNAASAGINYYRIKSVDVNGKVTFSAVVSVKQTGLVNTNIAVYPNPVKNKQLNFVLNTDAANYTLRVTSILGTTVVAKTITHNGGNASYSIALPGNLAKGTYFVKLTNGKDQLTKTITVE